MHNLKINHLAYLCVCLWVCTMTSDDSETESEKLNRIMSIYSSDYVQIGNPTF